MSVEARLEAALELIIDHRGRTPKKLGADFASAGVQVISAQNITENRLDLSANRRFVAPEVADKWMPVPLKAGDVLLSSEAPLGCVAVITDLEPRLVLGQRLFALRPQRSLLDAAYLAAALKSNPVRGRLLARASGTTAQGIRQAELRQVLVPLPGLSQQRAIAEVLKALDDKIESNRGVAGASEAVWLSAVSHALIDASRVQVAELITAGTLVVNDGYRAKNSELADTGVPFVRAGNLTADGLVLDEADLVPPDVVIRAGFKVAHPWDTAFTSKGTVGRITLVGPQPEPFVYSPQVCFWRSTKPEALSPLVLHAWMRSARFAAQVDAVKGQTDMADYVSLRDQRAMVIDVPTEPVQRRAQKIAEPMARLAWGLRREARTLAAIRDALLPRLVSGQVVIPRSDDPGEMVGMALEVHEAASAAQ